MNDEPALRIVARSSPLALAQARTVAEALPVPAEVVGISTRGDRTRQPLTQIGGRGLFTAELEAMLRRREAQLAVHSAKDLPAVIADDLIISAVPPREDPRDAVVSPAGVDLAGLPKAARVGTSSLRRAAQLRAVRPDLEAKALRGNVDTRIRKLHEGHYDAVVLAMAGLNRLGRTERMAGMVRPLEVEQFVPAAGQGALAVQCLAADEAARRAAARINDPDSAGALSAERELVRRLGATCRSAVGVYLWRGASAWRGVAMVADPAAPRKVAVTVRAATPERAGQDLFDRLAEAGAARLLRP